MSESDKKILSKVYDSAGIGMKKALSKNIEKVSGVVENSRPTLSQEATQNNKKKDKNIMLNTHTEADVNWASIVNKITIPNIVKGSITLGYGYAGSVIGAGLVTGLGFAILGPGGAVMGYYVGNVLGFGAGAVSGHKFGKIIASELEDKNHKDIVESGKSNVAIDTETVITEEKESKKNEFLG